jgi:hypothetical protein
MRRYVPLRLEAPRIQRQQIPSGLAGTRLTAAHVGRLIREGAADFYVRQKAIDILLECGVPPKDYLGEINALFRWVQRHVRYTKDPFQVEVLHSPRRMLELRAGDCDDMTILLGSLVKSIGHPVRIVLTGPNARRPDLFSHIYLEAQCQGDWIPLDATMPFDMGWSPRAPVRLVLSVEEDSTHDQRTASSTATTRTSTTTRPAARSGAGPGSRSASSAGPAPSTGTRLAPHLAVWDTPDRRAAARPTREGLVAPAATPAAPRAKRVDQGNLASHLGEGPRPTLPSAHHAPNGGAAAGVGSAPAAASGTVRDHRRPRTDGDEAAPPPPSGHTATGGGRATALDATRAGAPAVPADAASSGHAADGGRATPSRDAAAASPDAIAPTRALSGALDDASVLYRRFTRLPVRSVQRVSHHRIVPPVVVELGRLVAVMYRSDKWVGHPRTYIHYMEDPPRLVSDVAGRQLFVIGGNYRVTARGIEG